MRDVRLVELAGRQFNRVSRSQLHALRFDDAAIERRLHAGRLVIAEQGVYAVAPLLDDDRGSWMGATLTAPDTWLSHVSAAAARGFWGLPRAFETVTRPGNGGPRRHGGVLVFRSETLDGETTQLGPIPITTAERTLLDLAAHVSEKTLARALREAIRLEATTLAAVVDAIGRHHRRRGSARLARIAERYSGLPLRRARSGAEVQALILLREAGRVLPTLNRRIAGEEADLSWARHRLIIEIDGGPFHLDAGEDARKQAVWERAGWAVCRLPSDDVYNHPGRLLALAPPHERP
jgi:very-short-patch-repair endonuclease